MTHLRASGECVNCGTEPTVDRPLVHPRGCEHTLCLACFSELYEQLRDGGETELVGLFVLGHDGGCNAVRCRFCGEREPAGEASLSTMKLLGREGYEGIKALATRRALEALEEAVHCPTCQNLFLVTGGERVRCQKCTQLLCRRCRPAQPLAQCPHGGNVAAVIQAFWQYVGEHVLVKCPGCSVLYAKDDACNHVKCGQGADHGRNIPGACGRVSFCYGCGVALPCSSHGNRAVWMNTILAPVMRRFRTTTWIEAFQTLRALYFGGRYLARLSASDRAAVMASPMRRAEDVIPHVGPSSPVVVMMSMASWECMSPEGHPQREVTEFVAELFPTWGELN